MTDYIEERFFVFLPRFYSHHSSSGTALPDVKVSASAAPAFGAVDIEVLGVGRCRCPLGRNPHAAEQGTSRQGPCTV